ncbi:unnamed protein product [Medioppia subpectinata]|uniref:Uncharacterized protein n=1 Tax=Medioppia subpectinata TaxID=1979941 RepID=A0A7R9KM76_9ACAR|nr:unnamed protein product [Medioppia subpectinata]CAG2105084.1 unnamed protein product [Medioppia subpectinata]
MFTIAWIRTIGSLVLPANGDADRHYRRFG